MDFEGVISRIKTIKGLRHDHEVAELLGLTKTAFAERKRRDSIPRDKLALFCERESINMNWLLTGEGVRETAREAPAQIGIVREPKLDYIIDVIRAHNSAILNKMVDQLARIMDEGDYRKLAAIQSLLAVLVPGKEKEEE